MKQRKIVFAALAFFALIAFAAAGYRWFLVKPTLTVHLRCDAEVSGKLSVAVMSPNGETNNPESFDIRTICQNGKIELGNYQREKSVRFMVERGGVEKFDLLSEYGRNIQSDQNGFYMLLKVTNSPPFISNDSI